MDGEIFYWANRRREEVLFTDDLRQLTISTIERAFSLLELGKMPLPIELEAKCRDCSLESIWLPKYSPFLNPIERFWLHFKQLAVANRLHRSLKALQDSLDEVMTNQNTLQHPNRLILLDKFRLVA